MAQRKKRIETVDKKNRNGKRNGKPVKQVAVQPPTAAGLEQLSNPAVVVFGLDEMAKPKAAVFGPAHAALATKAAEAMRFRILPVTGAAIADVAAQLPEGRIHGRGLSFLPYVPTELYQRLDSLAGSPLPAPGLPETWDAIDVGHLVIACEGEGDWYQAIVTEREGDLLTLRWRDYPRQAKVVRHCTTVALLKPTAP
jgi:hypothetical protein